MDVSDIMTTEVHTASVEETAQEAIEKMARFNVGALPVISDDLLVGIVTDRDLLIRCVAEGQSPTRALVADHMTSRPLAVTPRDPIERAIEILTAHRVRRLPVVENGRVVGILSASDVARRVPNDALVARAARRRPRPGSVGAAEG
jgi:CBS domain-containing protein